MDLVRHTRPIRVVRVRVLLGVSVFVLLAPGHLLAQEARPEAISTAIASEAATPVADQPVTRLNQRITFFTDRAAFEALYPGLTLEDFEDLDVPPGTGCNGTPPLNAASSNPGCVSPGDIANGLQFDVVIGGGSGTYAAFGVGFISAPSNVLGPSGSSDHALLSFPGPGAVFAAGFDIACPLVQNVVGVSVSGATGFLGSTTVTCQDFPGTFLGMVSPDPIGEISLSHTPAAQAYEFLDNVLFGTQHDDLVLDFGGVFGTWVLYDNGPNTPLSPGGMSSLAAGESYAPLGPSPEEIATGDIDGNGRMDAVFDFPGFGLWGLDE